MVNGESIELCIISARFTYISFQIKAETLILQGDAKDKICEAAEELHVDLVVIGSRGLGTIKRLETSKLQICTFLDDLKGYLVELISTLTTYKVRS